MLGAVNEGVTACSQVLLEVQLLKNKVVNNQTSQQTSAAPLQGSDVSQGGAKASCQRPFQLPPGHCAGLACPRVQDDTGQCCPALTPPLLASGASRFPGDNGSMLKIGIRDLFPQANTLI